MSQAYKKIDNTEDILLLLTKSIIYKGLRMDGLSTIIMSRWKRANAVISSAVVFLASTSTQRHYHLELQYL